MYKLLLFVKKTNDEQVIFHFKEYTIKFLSNLAKKEIKIAEVESSLLADQKYSHFCELTFNSKEEFDQLMTTDEGKAVNKDLTDFHQYLNIIFINYND